MSDQIKDTPIEENDVNENTSPDCEVSEMDNFLANTKSIDEVRAELKAEILAEMAKENEEKMIKLIQEQFKKLTAGRVKVAVKEGIPLTTPTKEEAYSKMYSDLFNK